jgi:hypothetical protein
MFDIARLPCNGAWAYVQHSPCGGKSGIDLRIFWSLDPQLMALVSRFGFTLSLFSEFPTGPRHTRLFNKDYANTSTPRGIKNNSRRILQRCMGRASKPSINPTLVSDSFVTFPCVSRLVTPQCFRFALPKCTGASTNKSSRRHRPVSMSST